MRNLYGTPVITMTDLVKDLMISQNNLQQHSYLSTLLHGRYVWKDLLWNSIFAFKQVPVVVDDKNRICLPKDLIRLINVSVEDTRGHLQTIAENPAINTLDVLCPVKECSCRKCKGSNTLCELLDNIQMESEVVVIRGVEYSKTTWIRKGDCGTLQKETKTPYWDGTAVSYEMANELLCNLEVDEEQCITPTEANKELIYRHCGCYLPMRRHTRPTDLLPQPASYYGVWNWDAQGRDRIVLKNVTAKRLILCYQTSGDCGGGEEIVIPEYASEAMMMGIQSRMRAYAPIKVVSAAEKEYARQQYEAAKDKLWEFLHPFRIDDFMGISAIVPKWG